MRELLSPLRALSKRAALYGAVLLTACPGLALAQGAWSEIRVGDIAETREAQADLIMIAIDGSRDVPNAAVYELAPGQRSLRLASKKRDEAGAMIALPFTLDAAPCMRYALVADYAQPQANRSWRIAVKAQTPIKPCMRKYGASLSLPEGLAEAP
jgi:hypothetical protein